MKRRHDLNALVFLKDASQLCNAFLNIQQIFHSCISQYHYDLRPDGRNLSKQKWFAHSHLIGHGWPISGWPATIDVADQDFFSLEADGFNNLR